MIESILELNCPANVSLLNPSLLAKPDGGYLFAYRRDSLDPVFTDERRVYRLNALQYWGWKQVVVTEMNADFTLTGRELRHFEGEDPRLFRAMNRTWCAYATHPRSWRWWLMEVSMAHHFERMGEPFLPDFGTNRYVIGGPEKNWTWIDNPALQSFDCIYSFQPFRVLRFDETGRRINDATWATAPSWRFGPIRGGSPSILLPTGERLAIFHGFLAAGRYNRTYFAGAVLHEPDWPYRPIKVFQRPLLAGRRRFKRWPWLDCICPRTRVVYPCGVVAEPEGLLVSYGVDDCACAIAKFTYDELKTYDTGT